MLVLEGETLPIFRSSIKSKFTRDHYERHLGYFFEFVKSNADSFAEKARNDQSWTEKQIVSYIHYLKGRVESKEIAPSSVGNYIKPLRLYLEMNDLILNWKKLNRLLPSSKAKSKDRAPTIEEIKRICEYPDRRIRPIVLSMISGGFRLGAWDYLTWGDVEPLERKEEVIAAKVTVYRGEPEEYFTFITPEAFSELETYMDYRVSAGEKISKKSFLIRDLWKGDRGGKGEPHIPKRLASNGIKRLVEDALWAQNIRKKLEKGEKRHEFKTDHGFRKFHETVCIDSHMDIIKLKIIRGDSIELEDHYYRPTEETLLKEYEKSIPALTIFSKVTVVVSEDIESLKKDMATMKDRIAIVTEELKELRKFAEDAVRREKVSPRK